MLADQIHSRMMVVTHDIGNEKSLHINPFFPTI